MPHGASSLAPGFRSRTQTYTHECETSLVPSARRTFCRACLGKFMWYLWDVRPLYCYSMSIYLVFSVDQQLRADEGRCVGHTIIWLTLVIAVWGRDCISYTNTQPTLNLPLCALGVSVSDYYMVKYCIVLYGEIFSDHVRVASFPLVAVLIFLLHTKWSSVEWYMCSHCSKPSLVKCA